MNKQMVAQELVDVARELAAGIPPGFEHIRNDDWPYAVLVFNKRYVEFRIQMDETGDDVRTGKQPYGRNAPKAIKTVFSVLKTAGVPEENIQVL